MKKLIQVLTDFLIIFFIPIICVVIMILFLNGCKNPLEVKSGGNSVTGVSSTMAGSTITATGFDFRNAGMDIYFSSGAFIFKLLERYNQPVVKNEGGINLNILPKYPEGSEINKTKHIIEPGRETIESETIKPVATIKKDGGIFTLGNLLSIMTMLIVSLTGLLQVLFYNHTDTSVLKRITNFIFKKKGNK